MRRFQLHRTIDDSGVSGTGIVADGVEFDHQQAVLVWRGTYRTVEVTTVDTIVTIHGHGGHSHIVWLDPAPDEDQLCYVLRDLSNGDGADCSILPQYVWVFNRKVSAQKYARMHRSSESLSNLGPIEVYPLWLIMQNYERVASTSYYHRKREES